MREKTNNPSHSFTSAEPNVSSVAGSVQKTFHDISHLASSRLQQLQPLQSAEKPLNSLEQGDKTSAIPYSCGPVWPLQQSACILPAQTYLWRNSSSLRNPLRGHLHIAGSHTLAEHAEETYLMLASRNRGQSQWTEVALALEGKQWLTPAALSQTCKQARFQKTAFQRHIQDLTKSYSKDRKPFTGDVSRMKTC